MALLVNYHTGQKGTFIANFLNGGLAINPSTGASINLPGTCVLKIFMYTDIFVEAERLGIKLPSNLPHSMIDWNMQIGWMENDEVADFAFDRMLEEISNATSLCLSTQHLTMLKPRHIKRLEAMGHELVGIHSDEDDAKNIELELLFKTVDRESQEPDQIQQMIEYAKRNRIPLPPGRPVKEIDIRCLRMGFSPTDEHRVFVFNTLLHKTQIKKDWSDYGTIKMNKMYKNLSIRTVGYKQLYFYPYEGIIDLKSDANIDLWSQAVKKSWVPDKVEMFGETWYPREYGYNTGE